MAPAKGNKHAVGHGRPPNPGFSNEELIELGEELLLWMKANENKEIVHLSEFYSEVKGICPSYWKDNIADRESFRSYYKRAMAWMGKKLLKNKRLAPSYGNRFLGIYFKEVNESEFEQKKRIIDYEHSKKKETDSNIPPEAIERFKEFMNQVSGLQNARKIDDNKINEETKS